MSNGLNPDQACKIYGLIGVKAVCKCHQNSHGVFEKVYQQGMSTIDNLMRPFHMYFKTRCTLLNYAHGTANSEDSNQAVHRGRSGPGLHCLLDLFVRGVGILRYILSTVLPGAVSPIQSPMKLSSNFVCCFMYF